MKLTISLTIFASSTILFLSSLHALPAATTHSGITHSGFDPENLAHVGNGAADNDQLNELLEFFKTKPFQSSTLWPDKCDNEDGLIKFKNGLMKFKNNSIYFGGENITIDDYLNLLKLFNFLREHGSKGKGNLEYLSRNEAIIIRGRTTFSPPLGFLNTVFATLDWRLDPKYDPKADQGVSLIASRPPQLDLDFEKWLREDIFTNNGKLGNSSKLIISKPFPALSRALNVLSDPKAKALKVLDYVQLTGSALFNVRPEVRGNELLKSWLDKQK